MFFTFEFLQKHLSIHEKFMHRCLQLALLGQGHVAPNPMVGAVLVYEGRIIGEGYHQQYGSPHAEVNCLISVLPENKNLIAQSTLYVSLEPCAHFGKTPPCTELIIENKIPKVIVGCKDPFPEVAGKGIEKLMAAGIEVQVGIFENECLELNKRFITFHKNNRPFVVLKWARSADGKIAGNSARLRISNEYSNRLVHKWRSEEMAILVGTNTAHLDDPELTTRLWPGKDPIRLVLDRNLRLTTSLKLFSTGPSTIVFNNHQHSISEKRSPDNLKSSGLFYYQISGEKSAVQEIIKACFELNIQSILVEGGAQLLQSFINENSWDEARVICNEELIIGQGLAAPILKEYEVTKTESIFSDTHTWYRRNQT